MRAYSLDMRQHIVRAIDRGIPNHDIARVFGVSLATVKRYARLRRATGDLMPRPIPGRPRQLAASHEQALLAQLQASPDATLKQHRAMLKRAHGVSVSATTVSRAIARLGWTRKKKIPRAAERNAAAQAAWRLLAATLDSGRLVFVDECSVNLAMAPRYGRAPRGDRAIGTVPRKRGANITLIAALSLRGIEAAMYLEGAADAQVFATYVRAILAPALQPQQVVIMDNISLHEGAMVATASEQCQCQLLFLPPYPDGLVPIDEAFSKIKEYLRREEARTAEALDRAILQAIDAVSPGDARGWFRHCGYTRLPSSEYPHCSAGPPHVPLSSTNTNLVALWPAANHM
jgi:transposase